VCVYYAITRLYLLYMGDIDGYWAVTAMDIQAQHRSPMETRWIKKSLPKGPASHGNHGKYQSHNNCL
jgi:hypothetical protein